MASALIVSGHMTSFIAKQSFKKQIKKISHCIKWFAYSISVIVWSRIVLQAYSTSYCGKYVNQLKISRTYH